MPFTIAERIVAIVIMDVLATAALAGAGFDETWWGAAALGAFVGIAVSAYASLYNLVLDR